MERNVVEHCLLDIVLSLGQFYCKLTEARVIEMREPHVEK